MMFCARSGQRLSRLATILGATASLAFVPAAHAATDTQAPSVPPGFSATGGSTQVSLAWSASSNNVGVAGYNVWRRLASSTAWSRIAQTTKLAYTDINVTNGTGYVYAVRAYDAAGNISNSSPTITATPSTS